MERATAVDMRVKVKRVFETIQSGQLFTRISLESAVEKALSPGAAHSPWTTWRRLSRALFEIGLAKTAREDRDARVLGQGSAGVGCAST